MKVDDDKKKIDGEEEETEGGGTLSESALEAFDEEIGDDSIESLAEKELDADEEEDASAFFDVAPEDRW